MIVLFYVCTNHSIPVGINNIYGHTNKKLLNNLDNSKIYRTDENGSILFYINKERINITTFAP